MTYAITAENLGKRYLIGHQRKEQYSTLRDTFAHGTRTLLHRFLHPNLASSGPEIEEFWALKDVHFEIHAGDRIGIIGRNGAGKSTLLKILSRITEPSTGRFITRGRVASLLEVGTGFHPELTGRENIFLNGAILGMSKADVKQQFDAIVDFSGVEIFLDTPVKRYSSGMYVRLAFAVAAHLDPDILIVDEVLAVGDAEFQKKCLGKMKEVGKEGRTVVFVSHNMGAVSQLCTKAALLERGKWELSSDNVSLVIDQYQKSLLASDIGSPGVFEGNTEYFNIVDFVLEPQNGVIIPAAWNNSRLPSVKITADIHISDPSLNLGFALYNHLGHLLFWSVNTDTPPGAQSVLCPGRITLKAALPSHFLNEGDYQIRLLASLHNQKWLMNPDAGSPTIPLIIRGGLSDSPFWHSRRPGECAPVLDWKTEVIA